jgi:YihY family inner membrane protein
MKIAMASDTINKVKSNKTVQEVEKDVRPLQQFFQKFGNDWSTIFAGSLAYSLLTAMLPIAIAIVAIFGLVLGGDTAKSKQYLATITNIFSAKQSGGLSASLLTSVSTQLNHYAGWLIIIAILVAIFGGSRLFVVMEQFLDLVYRVRPRPSLARNGVAILMMIIFIVLIPVMVFTATLPGFAVGLIQKIPVLNGIPFFIFIVKNPVVLAIASYLGGLLSTFILFEAIFFIVPNQKISWKNSWRGALVSAILLDIFVALFPVYTSLFLKNYAGQIGFAVVLLLFFYYFAVILMLGGEINAFFFEKVRPLPNDLATFVSTVAGNINRDRPSSESDSHVNAEPTQQADNAHIARQRRKEQRNQAKNQRKEQNVVQQAQASQDTAAKQQKQPGRLSTVLEVVLGSALAMVIALLRTRDIKR